MRRPIAEAGLRGRAERLGDRIDDDHVEAHQRELGAGRQADLQHLPPHAGTCGFQSAKWKRR